MTVRDGRVTSGHRKSPVGPSMPEADSAHALADQGGHRLAPAPCASLCSGMLGRALHLTAAITALACLATCAPTERDVVVVVATVPADGAVGVAPGEPIVVTFDRPMDVASVEAAFAIEPTASGLFTWDATATTLQFLPDPPLATRTRYEVTLADTAAAATDGKTLGDDVGFAFTTFDDSRFAGPDGDPVDAHLPDVPLPDPDPGDVIEQDRVPVASRDLLVSFAPETTVATANALLAELDAVIAGALPPMGVVLLRRHVGAADLDTLVALQREVDAHPAVHAAALNVYLAAERLPPHGPRPTGPGTRPWIWDVQRFGVAGPQPDRGNWFLKAIRMPQAWNLYERAARSPAAASVAVGVLDVETADPAHEDLTPRVAVLAGAVPDDHATAVAGIIAATWDNRRGVEGVHPLNPRIVARRGANGVMPADTFREWLSQSQLLNALLALLRQRDVRVINISAGLSGHFRRATLDPVTTRLWFDTWADQMDDEGESLLAAIQSFERSREGRADFLVTCSAGNLAVRPSTTEDYLTRYNSACTNIAARVPGLVVDPLGAGADHFIAVEATDANNARAYFSAAGGTVSAPGEDIMAPSSSQPYEVGPGTSYAAPQVAGLVAWLSVLDPSLTWQELRALVTDPSHTVAVGAPTSGGAKLVGARRIDAFASSLGIDALRGDTAIRSALVDVDDGTPDGNRRAVRDDENRIVQQDRTFVASDGLRGDGQVSMRDFRAFRDAMIDVLRADGALAAGDVDLDGDADHQKRDLNGDGCVFGTPLPSLAIDCSAAPAESSYARFDFNGDGVLARDAKAPVAGSQRSDLDVLKSVWPASPELGEGLGAGDLDALLPDGAGHGGSGDITFRPAVALGPTGDYDEVQIGIPYARGIVTRTLKAEHKEQVWTVPRRSAGPVTLVGFKGGARVKDLCAAREQYILEALPDLDHGQDVVMRVVECEGPVLAVERATLTLRKWYTYGITDDFGEQRDERGWCDDPVEGSKPCAVARSRCTPLEPGQTCHVAAAVAEPLDSMVAEMTLEQRSDHEWVIAGSLSASASAPPLLHPPGESCEDVDLIVACEARQYTTSIIHVTVPIKATMGRAHRVVYECAGSGDRSVDPKPTWPVKTQLYAMASGLMVDDPSHPRPLPLCRTLEDGVWQTWTVAHTEQESHPGAGVVDREIRLTLNVIAEAWHETNGQTNSNQTFVEELGARLTAMRIRVEEVP